MIFAWTLDILHLRGSPHTLHFHVCGSNQNGQRTAIVRHTLPTGAVRKAFNSTLCSESALL